MKIWVLGFILAGHGALAEMVRQSVPVEVAVVGGYCDHEPEKYLAAPSVPRGKIEFDHHGIDFVVFGDRVKLETGLGIGLQARVEGFGPGDVVTVQIIDPVGAVSKWNYKIPGAGVFQFGQLPPIGGALLPGGYRFSAFDHGKELFAYDMVVEGPAGFGPCDPAPETS